MLPIQASPSDSYFLSLGKLDFRSAKEFANQETNAALRGEMLQLVDILYNEGQVERTQFKYIETPPPDDFTYIVHQLSAGYLSLFYDETKKDAYQHFYEAYQRAKSVDNPIWIKPCLHALLRYYHSEVEQDKDYHQLYIDQFEYYQSNPIDKFWLTIFKMVFLTKAVRGLPEDYSKLNATLSQYEKDLDPTSPLLGYLYYERALHQQVTGDLQGAISYFKRTIDIAGAQPFLRTQRFNAALHLTAIESTLGHFDAARMYLANAKKDVARYDTLRSSYIINAYTSVFMKNQKKYDSAFNYLLLSTQQDLELRARATTLEINRLNVELETREKENANLQLKQDRTWLVTALIASVLLLAAGYFAYTSQRAKAKVQLQTKEVQAMKLEKQLREQEVIGIDLMIEGQEKERQRIANDLHDDLGGHLAAIKIKLESLERLKLEKPQSDLLQETSILLNEAYQRVRSMAHERNAGINAQEGLLPAVRNFAAKVSIANRLTIQVEEHGMNTRLENSLEITIFRVIQELMTNVIKHANASEVFIHLTQHENSINVMVEDNGMGFDLSHVKSGGTMGLHSIQKRIESLGGAVTIESIVEKGTTVIIDIPLS